MKDISCLVLMSQKLKDLHCMFDTVLICSHSVNQLEDMVDTWSCKTNIPIERKPDGPFAVLYTSSLCIALCYVYLGMYSMLCTSLSEHLACI